MVVADLEIHSRYARACSKTITPNELNSWAKRKGVNILSTGDITHPLWRREIQKSLIQKETGFFVLKEEANNPQAPRFVLGGEVSLMYSSNAVEAPKEAKGASRHLEGENSTLLAQGARSKGRRVHVLFLAPSFVAVEALVARIQDKGKLASDGRPILGMSCRDFAYACQEADPNIIVIPAHIWTPWFGLLGSKSGFDSVEEGFGDMAPTIKAYETGLSADPEMCWRLQSLNRRVLISGSDLHSSPNMMREATLLNGKIEAYDYARLAKAITKLGSKDYYGTLEFFPEEGKYHADGHAACKVILDPEQTKKLNGRCPSCGGVITVGVKYRVHELAQHPQGHKPAHGGVVIYSVPLQEIIAEALEKRKQAKAVQAMYFHLTDTLGTEYAILHERKTFPGSVPARIVQGIYKVRNGEVRVEPGYDGIYGVVKLFEPHKTMLSFWDIST